jgi:hypothetical protein
MATSLYFMMVIIVHLAATAITLSLRSNIGCRAGATQASNLLQLNRPR